MIAHFSLPARDPKGVAELFARLISGVAMPFPVVPGAWVAIARDGSGCGVEVLPEASAHHPGTGPSTSMAAQGPQVMPWEVQIRQDGSAQSASGVGKGCEFHVLRLGRLPIRLGHYRSPSFEEMLLFIAMARAEPSIPSGTNWYPLASHR
jgi:hypothetical protein